MGLRTLVFRVCITGGALDGTGVLADLDGAPLAVPQASIIYSEMRSPAVEREDIELDRQLVFYNDLFSWARVAFEALTDRPPPDILYGPSSQGDLRRGYRRDDHTLYGSSSQRQTCY